MRWKDRNVIYRESRQIHPVKHHYVYRQFRQIQSSMGLLLLPLKTGSQWSIDRDYQKERALQKWFQVCICAQVGRDVVLKPVASCEV